MPEQGQTQTTEDQPEVNIAHITLMNLQDILMDPAKIAEDQLHPFTCQYILKQIQDMMKHGGLQVVGIRTLDGMVMYPCAKHGYGPISMCMKEPETDEPCPFFDGHDNLGICTCKEEKIVGYQQYAHMEAVKKEEMLRTDVHYEKTAEGELDEDLEEDPDVDDW